MNTEKNDRFTVPYTVYLHMTDKNGRCHAGDLLRLMQDCATLQLEHLGPTMTEMRDAQRVFLLTRISIDIRHPFAPYESLYAQTWPCTSSRGAVFDRDFLLHTRNSSKEISDAAVVGASQWALLDTAHGKLLRVDDIGIPFAREEKVQTSIPLRFRIPRDLPLVCGGERTVRFTDIDRNGHMNNTRYADLFCDYLPQIAAGMRITAFAISYQKEARLGDVLRVMYTETPDENGLLYVRTVRVGDGTVNMEAAIRLASDIPSDT
ncbi:MAG: hypothetical protein IJC98_01970 [Clostridia bacterium]|nr:hypothetical protein [Clostridia bacterium]